MKGSILIQARELLSRGHGLLERFSVERRRFDGRKENLAREIYDPGDGAAILLYDPARSRVVLVRQFRLATYLRDGHESFIEVCAGRLEGEDAESRIIKEAEEETGFAVRSPRRLFDAYMSPGCFAEKLTFFVAQYSAADRAGKGGGREDEGEDIEVLEPTLEEALAMIDAGRIVDAKTIILLQYAKLAGLMQKGKP
ncbi:MAG TPA: NUDIX domain-containing protein [Methylocella sp.]|nr:NUDIX domain-containing protein [Methylocella sp.]